MNTSVPWSINDLSSEARNAAADAARRAGVPLADWLDTVIAEQAGDVGERQTKLGDRDRLRAVTAEMSRLTGRVAQDPPAAARPVAPEGASASGRGEVPSSDPLRAMSQRLADLERHTTRIAAPDRPGRATPPRDAHPTEDTATAVMREAVAEIARRQAALEADTAETAPAPTAGNSEADTSRRRQWRDNTAETRSSKEEASDTISGRAIPGDPRERSAPATEGLDDIRRDLRQAIKDIDPRGDVQQLDRHVRSLEDRIEAVAAVMPPGSVLSAIGDQTREMRDLLAAAVARPQPADRLHSQIADLQQRLDGLGNTDTQHASRAADWSEMRAQLDRLASGSALETLDRRVQDLSARVDAGLHEHSMSPLLEDLAKRIDHVQASLGTPRDNPVDTRPLEALVRGIGERIEGAQLASASFDQLEQMMASLSDKIDRNRQPLDTQALEAQISRLGSRLEQSEAGLAALDSVERTLGELFNQLEATRNVAIDAAETAARTAARDTLRAAMQARPGSAPATDPAALAEVRQVLDEVRSQHDAADRRTHATLVGLHQTMEKLVEHLSKLEQTERRSDQAERPPGPPAPPSAPVIMPPSPETSKPERAAAPPPVEPAYRERFRQEQAARRPERSEEPADSLIEPGAGRKPRDAAADDKPGAARQPVVGAPDALLPPGREGQGAASYIAAARRAAQAAQASAAAQKQGKAGRGFGDGGSLPLLTRAKDFLAHRRRPILLSVAALVLLLGALEIVKVSMDEPPQRVGAVDSPTIALSGARTPDQGVRVADAEPAPQASAAQIKTASPQPGPDRPPAEAPAAEAEVAPPAAKAALTTSNPFLSGMETSAAGQIDGLRKLAASGDPAAQYELGLRYAEGRMLNRDPKAAAVWFEKAAAQGLAPAQYRMGSAYEKGIGVTRDPALAVSWYGRAADAGNIKAMHNLAVMSADGSLGKPDYAKAASWFGKAAALGVRDSQFNLAILYAKGLGIEQSLSKSYTWFAIAATQGDDDAGKKRDEVASKLDAKSLASAKEAADGFRPGTAIGAANEVASSPIGSEAAAPGAKPPAATQKGAASKVTTM